VLNTPYLPYNKNNIQAPEGTVLVRALPGFRVSFVSAKLEWDSNLARCVIRRLWHWL